MAVIGTLRNHSEVVIKVNILPPRLIFSPDGAV